MSESVNLSAVKHFPDYAVGMDAESLVFFVAVAETHSLPKAAERLGISLSSANRQLAKLRQYFNEPLFERSGFQMTPTESAKQRLTKVRAILKLLAEVRQPETELQPENVRITVRIAAYDNACAVGIAGIFPAFRARFPHVTFQVLQADGHLFDDLTADRLDMAFFARQGLPPGLHSMSVFTTPYVVVTAKGHPLEKRAVGRGLDREDLSAFKQVLVNTQPDRERSPNSPANGWFNPATPDGIAAVIPFFLAAPLCLAGTDCYAVVPEASAKLFVDEDQFSLLPVTEKAPKLTVSLAWHERTHTDPAAQLIRSAMTVLIGERVSGLLKHAV